jgi:hypothetical protein
VRRGWALRPGGEAGAVTGPHVQQDAACGEV